MHQETELKNGDTLVVRDDFRGMAVLSTDNGRIAIPIRELPTLIGELTKLHLETLHLEVAKLYK